MNHHHKKKGGCESPRMEVTLVYRDALPNIVCRQGWF